MEIPLFFGCAVMLCDFYDFTIKPVRIGDGMSDFLNFPAAEEKNAPASFPAPARKRTCGSVQFSLGGCRG
jgi:hypothetical protein